jgi:hypothetical protein
MKKYTYRGVRRAGKKDGRNWRWKFWPFSKSPKESQPEQTQEEPSEFEKELKEGSETIIRRLLIAWENLDTKLKPIYCKLLGKIRGLKEQLPREIEEARWAKDRYEEAAQKYHELLPSEFSKKWLMIWLVFLAVVEFPINSIVFSIFAEGTILTYIMAAIIIIIPLAAHFVGHPLRQESKIKLDWLLIIVVPIVIIGVVFGFGFLRAQFLSAVLSRIPVGLSISPAAATLIFLAFNLAIFVVAAVISYWGTHPQNRVYKNRKEMFQDALEIFEKESGDAKRVSQQLADALSELTVARHNRDKKWRWHSEQANEVKERAEFSIAIYRKANMEKRPSAAVPESFKKPPLKADIPENFQTLEWECPELNLQKNSEEK